MTAYYQCFNLNYVAVLNKGSGKIKKIKLSKAEKKNEFYEAGTCVKCSTTLPGVFAFPIPKS